ncbi:MAG: V-type ATP synthase subunit A [Culturomica sp.]|jgi:V/A-type H+-transporting ATPase subunit A|nr:V-type ATP synthase subunit A [Culturomica sp.]
MEKTVGKIHSIISNLVLVRVEGPVSQNEICFIEAGNVRLMAEVIKFTGELAYIQVFESTRGLKPGMPVEFEQHLLEASLGPGLLSKNFDGLQNDLNKMTGLFLKRGEYTHPLEEEKKWLFEPLAKPGDTVRAADWLGSVKENWLDHKIMVPFKLEGEYTVESVAEAGEYTILEPVAVLKDKTGKRTEVTMMQKWPVKLAIKKYAAKPRPFTQMETGMRVIDTMNPMLEGGTGFIPGPFGTGKTVLQHSLARFADADVIIMAACGERANEVVEIFTEFPKLQDPRSGRSLYERTTIIANTSNMPVAAREASVYTAMTIGEYYRAMGLKVLLLADSTSRWAQALREMSNRMEELPGQDAFPMDLSAIIANFYARAGLVYLNNGKTGSVTFIGTVSPAGGNLKEPVTESTQKVARCFYALSQARADSKRYPAINTLESYSKYLEYPEFREYAEKRISATWIEEVNEARDALVRGIESAEQIDILGDDGVPVEYHVLFWKSELLDGVILHQDAFDEIDGSTSMERQRYMLGKILEIVRSDFAFESFDEVNPYFKRILNSYKQMNYTPFLSVRFKKYEQEIAEIVAEKIAKKQP